MSILSIIGAGFSWLTGNSNSANKAVDAVINSGDALIFTDQEKDISNHKKLDFIIDHAKATQKMSISRRVITASVSFLFIVFSLIWAVAAYYDTSVGSYSVEIKSFMKEIILQPFSIILAFYFITPMVTRK